MDKLTIILIVASFIAVILIFVGLYQSVDNFGALPNNEEPRKDYQYLAQQLNPTATAEVEIREFDIDAKDPNYNTLNDLPFLIDPQNPNKGYYYNRVKIETNPNSELMKKEQENIQKINEIMNNHVEPVKQPNEIGFKGYNNYVNLGDDNYANIYALGKSLLTPYAAWPLPS